jgi:hypothetical protein
MHTYVHTHAAMGAGREINEIQKEENRKREKRNQIERSL